MLTQEHVQVLQGLSLKKLHEGVALALLLLGYSLESHPLASEGDASLAYKALMISIILVCLDQLRARQKFDSMRQVHQAFSQEHQKFLTDSRKNLSEPIEFINNSIKNNKEDFLKQMGKMQSEMEKYIPKQSETLLPEPKESFGDVHWTMLWKSVSKQHNRELIGEIQTSFHGNALPYWQDKGMGFLGLTSKTPTRIQNIFNEFGNKKNPDPYVIFRIVEEALKDPSAFRAPEVTHQYNKIFLLYLNEEKAALIRYMKTATVSNEILTKMEAFIKLETLYQNSIGRNDQKEYQHDNGFYQLLKDESEVQTFLKGATDNPRVQNILGIPQGTTKLQSFSKSK